MSDNRIYIDTNRILDSCRDKDCFENVPVYLTDTGNDVVEHSTNARTKSCEIISSTLAVDPVPFNKGFYTVNIRIFCRVLCECCTCMGRSQEVEGICTVQKQVILYGGEGNVSIFKSDPKNNSFCPGEIVTENGSTNMPTAVLEIVDPIVLGTKIGEPRSIGCRTAVSPCGSENCLVEADMPESVASRVNGRLCYDENGRRLLLTLGFFSVVRIERPGQFLVSGCEYTVPEKECLSPSTDDPCDVFRHIAFPVNEFTPSASSGIRPESGEGCGCGKK